jgi:hypothetical protein
MTSLVSHFKKGWYQQVNVCLEPTPDDQLEVFVSLKRSSLLPGFDLQGCKVSTGNGGLQLRPESACFIARIN